MPDHKIEDWERDISQGGMSMGAGRRLPPSGECSNAPDGKHHYRAVSCIQSIEHFCCEYCDDEYYD